jgi:HlyD family secretion protein
MFARGEFELGASAAATVPQAAVVLREGFSYVFAVGSDGRVKQHKVQTGRIWNSDIEVLSGLPQGASVVASGAGFLNDGDLVRVAK